MNTSTFLFFLAILTLPLSLAAQDTTEARIKDLVDRYSKSKISVRSVNDALKKIEVTYGFPVISLNRAAGNLYLVKVGPPKVTPSLNILKLIAPPAEIWIEMSPLDAMLLEPGQEIAFDGPLQLIKKDVFCSIMSVEEPSPPRQNVGSLSLGLSTTDTPEFHRENDASIEAKDIADDLRKQLEGIDNLTSVQREETFKEAKDWLDKRTKTKKYQLLLPILNIAPTKSEGSFSVTLGASPAIKGKQRFRRTSKKEVNGVPSTGWTPVRLSDAKSKKINTNWVARIQGPIVVDKDISGDRSQHFYAMESVSGLSIGIAHDISGRGASLKKIKVMPNDDKLKPGKNPIFKFRHNQ